MDEPDNGFTQWKLLTGEKVTAGKLRHTLYSLIYGHTAESADSKIASKKKNFLEELNSSKNKNILNIHLGLIQITI